MEILLFSFLMYVISHITPRLLLLKFFPYQNEGGKDSHKKMNIPVPFYYQSSVTRPFLVSQNDKKPEVNKKLSMQDTYVEKRLCIFLVQMLRTVSISFINSKLVRMLYLEGLVSNIVKTVIHHYYCVPVKSFILINMRLTSPYVQE